jgi:hypothetical protein
VSQVPQRLPAGHQRLQETGKLQSGPSASVKLVLNLQLLRQL